MLSRLTVEELGNQIVELGNQIQQAKYIYKKYYNTFLEMSKEETAPNIDDINKQLMGILKDKRSIPTMRSKAMARIVEFEKRVAGFEWNYSYHYVVDEEEDEYIFVGMVLFDIAPKRMKKENEKRYTND